MRQTGSKGSLREEKRNREEGKRELLLNYEIREELRSRENREEEIERGNRHWIEGNIGECRLGQMEGGAIVGRGTGAGEGSGQNRLG